MAQDKIKIKDISKTKLVKTNFGFITQEEYKAYQKLRRKRAQVNRMIANDFERSLNLTYSSSLYLRRLKEKQGKRFTIRDIKSRYEFDQFMNAGLKYSNFDEYKKRKALEYTFNMRGAFKNLSGDDPAIMERFDEVIANLDDPYMLDEIYSQSEELDLSFVYVEAKEQGVERLEYTLDVLEQKIKLANRKA